MGNVQTGGRFNANDEVCNSSDVFLHKWVSEAALVFKYVNLSCKDEKKHFTIALSEKATKQPFKVLK